MDPSKPQEQPAPSVDAALRGLSLLMIAYAALLGGAIIGGALRTHYLTQLWTDRSGTASSEWMWLVVGGFFGFHLVASGVVLLGLAGVADSPPASRVSGLARTALALFAVSLGLTIVSYGLSRYGQELLPTGTMGSLLSGIGYVDTALDLAGTVLLIESLLRLRRYAAPDAVEIAANESLLRGGLIALFVVRILVDHLSHLLRAPLNAAFGTNFWPSYFVRALLTLLFSGTLLYLIQATSKALRTKPRTLSTDAAAAHAADGTTPAELLNRGYRNLIFGALWAIGGAAVTVITYQQASTGGGRFLFAYGAIIFGLIQFIRGLTQVIGRS